MEFHVRLKKLRMARGWTQEDLARRLGVSRNTVAGYESPRKSREPSLDILLKMADVFAVSLDQLLGRPWTRQDDLVRVLEDRETLLMVNGSPLDPDPVPCSARRCPRPPFPSGYQFWIRYGPTLSRCTGTKPATI